VATGQPRGRRRPARETRDEARARRAVIDDPEAVLAAAARLLESRPRAVAEVRRHLAFAGYRADLVEGAIARLVQFGYLDDTAFAAAWIASRDRAHPRGERALRAELMRKGVPREVVDAAIGEREAAGRGAGATGDPDAGEDADDRAATQLLERRRSSLERVVDPRIRRERAYGLLARAGFDPDAASRAIARFTPGATDEGPPEDV
jgi:regulatory protein